MITCDLNGGLGNQLFQIFTTISLALETSSTFYFNDKGKMQANPGTTERETFFKKGIFKFSKGINLTPNVQLPYEVEYCESVFGFDQNLYENARSDLSKGKSVMIRGYFQDKRYFEKNFDTILKDFLGLDKVSEELKIYLSKTHPFKKYFGSLTTSPSSLPETKSSSRSTSVSLHFRLGDYKKYLGFHPILPVSYYIDSLAYILENEDEVEEFDVFCFFEKEDWETVSKMVNIIREKMTSKSKKCINLYLVPDFFPEAKDWEELILMSLFDHAIIANSSFSWWGAFLNRKNENKIVCYPSVWFTGEIGSKINVNCLFDSHDFGNWKRILI